MPSELPLELEQQGLLLTFLDMGEGRISNLKEVNLSLKGHEFQIREVNV